MSRSSSEMGPLGCLVTVAIIVAITVVPCAFAWDYSVSKWLVHFGKPDSFGFWHGFLVSCVPGVGQIGLLAAVATFIAFMFL